MKTNKYLEKIAEESGDPGQYDKRRNTTRRILGAALGAIAGVGAVKTGVNASVGRKIIEAVKASKGNVIDSKGVFAPTKYLRTKKVLGGVLGAMAGSAVAAAPYRIRKQIEKNT